MKIKWTPEATQDRADIWDYIAAENPQAAARIDQHFSDAAVSLAFLPHRGTVGRIPGTRELFPHEHYRLVYETHNGTVWILALVHTARQWPPQRG